MIAVEHRRVPGRPARAGGTDPVALAATRTPSSVTSYCVSDAMRASAASSVTPVGVRVDEEQVDVVGAVAGAGEHEEAGRPTLANGTCHFVAVEHEAVAVGARRVACDALRAEAALGLEPRRA